MLLQIWALGARLNGIPKEMQRSKRSKYDINKCLLYCLYCHNSNHPCVIGAIIFGCVWHAASRAHVWSALIQMHVGSLRLDSWTLAVFATFFSESFVVCLHGRPPTYQPINPSICWSDDPIVYQCVFWSVSEHFPWCKDAWGIHLFHNGFKHATQLKMECPLTWINCNATVRVTEINTCRSATILFTPPQFKL